MGKIFSITGNPFVDAGIYVIAEWAEKKIEDIDIVDLKKLYPKLIEIYFTSGWKKMLESIFTGNHPVTHKKSGNQNYYKKFLEGWIQDIEDWMQSTRPPLSSGTCFACGRRNKSSVERKYGIGRDLVPLTGSGDFVNFFPMASLGLDMCSACLLAIQFMPIFLHYSGGKFLLLHSNSEKVMKYWAKNSVVNLNKQIVVGNFTGCYSNNINDPVNSFFRSIEDIVREYDENWVDEDAFIRFYYFSNYGQSPHVEIFDIPTPVFRFLAYVKQAEAYDEWREVVNRASGRRNEVYERLLKGKSIVRYFFKGEREIFGNWKLLKFYLREVKEMDERRINAIREFADRIANLIQMLDSVKRLEQIERAKDYAEFRNVLLSLARDGRNRAKLEEPLVRYDEYVSIFPEGAMGWNEVRDLILFRIYEVLHTWLVERKGIESTEQT